MNEDKEWIDVLSNLELAINKLTKALRYGAYHNLEEVEKKYAESTKNLYNVKRKLRKIKEARISSWNTSS